MNSKPYKFRVILYSWKDEGGKIVFTGDTTKHKPCKIKVPGYELKHAGGNVKAKPANVKARFGKFGLKFPE